MKWVKRSLGALLPAFLIAVCVARCAIRLRPTPEAVVLPDAAAPAPAVDPGPPCMHETCGERPKYLKCVSWPGAHECGTFEVLYEHHCNCDRWAPMVGGGAP